MKNIQLLVLPLMAFCLLLTSCIKDDILAKQNSIIAAFTSNKTVIISGSQVQFTDQSTDSPESWRWDFGDGETSLLQNPIHQFDSIGLYTISLTVTTSDGVDTETKMNYIEVTNNTITHDDNVELLLSGSLSIGEISGGNLRHSTLGLKLNTETGESGHGDEFWFGDIHHADSNIQGTYTIASTGSAAHTNGTMREIVLMREIGGTNHFDYHNLVDGELNITKLNNEYRIIFSGTDTQGKGVSIYYYGELKQN